MEDERRETRDAIPRRKHYAELDGLRGVAAMLVMVGHFLYFLRLPEPPNYILAVDFFFLLSGFVVQHAYGDRLASGSITFRKFVRLRLLRLHPLLILGTVVGLIVHLAIRQFGDTGGPLAPIFGAAISGILSIPYHSLHADRNAFPLNIPQWSLFAEYVVNLLFAAVASRLGGRRLAAMIAVGAAAIIALVMIDGGLGRGPALQDWPTGIARAIFPFFLGVALSRLKRNGKLPSLPAPWWLLAIGLIAVIFAPSNGLVHLAAVMLLFPLIVISGSSDRPSRGSAAMLWTGAISYPLYILHYPVGWALSRVAIKLFPASHLWWMPPVMIIVAVAAAQLALEYFDKPIRNALEPSKRTSDRRQE